MDCVIEVLQNHNIAYLVESNTSFDPYYRPGIKDGLLNLMKMVPESLIISNNEGNLVSVAILARKLKQ
jgi:hypothetical protein